MTKETLQLLPCVVYMAILLWLLFLEAKRGLLTGKDITARQEALGTQTYTTVVIAMTLIGSNLGPADTLGLSDRAKQYGFFFLIFPVLAGFQQAVFR